MFTKTPGVVGVILDIFPGPFAMLTACLDESKNGPIFCVSGILLDRKSLKALDREWKRELRTAEIPYFHAVDCAHGKEKFEGKDKEFRMCLHRRMCEIMAKHLLGSVTVLSMPWHFQFNRTDWGYSEYAVCAFLCMNEMFALADQLGRKKSVTFFIEDGNEMEADLRKLIQAQIKAGRHDIMEYQFVGKQGLRAVQAADIFAYEVCKRIQEKSKEPDKPTEKSMRKSLQAISAGAKHRVIWLDHGQRESFARLVSRPSG